MNKEEMQSGRVYIRCIECKEISDISWLEESGQGSKESLEAGDDTNYIDSYCGCLETNDRSLEQCKVLGNIYGTKLICHICSEYVEKLEAEIKELEELIAKAENDQCGCLGGLLV